MHICFIFAMYAKIPSPVHQQDENPLPKILCMKRFNNHDVGQMKEATFNGLDG